MPKMIGSADGKEYRRILEGALKPFVEEVRRGIHKNVKNRNTSNLEELTSETILKARTELVDMVKTLYNEEDREIEIAVKALEVWYRRTEMARKRAIEREWR